MNIKEWIKYLLLLVVAPRSLKTMEWRMLRLLNKDRRRHGLIAILMQDDLRTVARKHSLDMAKRDFFDHVNIKSQSPADRLILSGVSDTMSGENLAKIGGFKNPTQHAETGLMNSPGHRANILNKMYNCVGIGVIQSKDKVYYFTQNFAKRYLVFKRKIPKIAKLKKGLFLRGNAFLDVRLILCQIKLPKTDKVIYEKQFNLRGDDFSFLLSFKDLGIHEVFLFVNLGTKGEFVLANKFKIKVRKGLFSL